MSNLNPLSQQTNNPSLYAKDSNPAYNSQQNQQEPSTKEPVVRQHQWIRFGIFLFCLTFIFLGRAALPDHPVPTIVDRAMESLEFINFYVMDRPRLRDAMLIGCTFFMDVMFFATGIYWILYGNSSRIIVSILFFYATRAAVQQMFYCPYPKHYFWDDPGFPTLVVPYGRSSDFFFSGHVGFVTLCTSEWIKHKQYLVASILALGGLYTVFILLVYQAHYSIDIFTGMVVGSWIFLLVDKFKEDFDAFFIMIYETVLGLFKIIFGASERRSVREREQELIDVAVTES